MSDGLKKLTTLASIEPIRRPADWSSAMATGSPNDAARATSSRRDRATLVERDTQPRGAAVDGRGRARPAEGRAAGQRLEAAEIAAAADDRRVIDDLDVADVAGTALGAAVEVAVRDDAGPDAGADLDDHHVVVAGRHAGAPLAERQQVDVVVHPDRRAVPRGEPFPDRVAVPAGHDRRRDRAARSELDRTGNPDADAPQPTGEVLRGGQKQREQRVHAVQAALRPGLDPGRFIVMAQDPTVEAW